MIYGPTGPYNHLLCVKNRRVKMNFIKEAILFTIENYPAFLIVGGLATAIFAAIASKHLIKSKINNIWRGVIYATTTLMVSIYYESTSGITELVDGSTPMNIILMLWVFLTILLGITTVTLWSYKSRLTKNT